MPHQKEKNNRKLWDKNLMIEAIITVRKKKLGLKTASRLFLVPKTTLFRFVNSDLSPEEAVNGTLGRKPVLPQSLEEELIDQLVLMEKRYYGFTKKDLRSLAYQLAVKNKVKHPFSNEIAGRAWLNHFLSRHNQKFTLTKPSEKSSSRFVKQSVDKFFSILSEEYEKYDYPPERIFCVNETALTIMQTDPLRVVEMRGKPKLEGLTDEERHFLVTVVCSMSASGIFIPPMMIFPRKINSRLLQKGAPPGSLVKCHSTGWIQISLFTQWFHHFIEQTKPSASSPVLLILDGHSAHSRNIELLQLANNNHVCLVSLPPTSSDRLQPLDLSFMPPLIQCYTKEIQNRQLSTGKLISIFEISELFGRAFETCQSKQIAADGFRLTGIYPFNLKALESRFVRNKSNCFITNLHDVVFDDEDTDLIPTSSDFNNIQLCPTSSSEHFQTFGFSVDQNYPPF